MAKPFEEHSWKLDITGGVVTVHRDGELVGKGHWDGRRLVHADYRLSSDHAQKLDRLVTQALPTNAWQNADAAADELVADMSAADKQAISDAGDAEEWRGAVAGNRRASGLDHSSILQAMYELVRRDRGDE